MSNIMQVHNKLFKKNDTQGRFGFHILVLHFHLHISCNVYYIWITHFYLNAHILSQIKYKKINQI